MAPQGIAVLVGGFAANDPELSKVYDRSPSYDLPSVHIIGRSDHVVPAEMSRALASRLRKPLVLKHDGGHVIASTSSVKSQFRAFLEAMVERKVRRQAGP